MAVVPAEAEALQRSGFFQDAWRLRLGILGPTFALRSPHHRHNLLFQTVDALFAEGRFDLAGLFAREMLANSRAWPKAAATAEALSWCARIAAVEDLGDLPRQELARAEAIAREEPPGPLRERLLADVAAMAARALLASDPGEARERASAALAGLAASGQEEQIPLLLLSRARASQKLGRPAEARADLEAALAKVEERRGLAPDKSARVHYLALHQSIFDELVRANLALGDSWAAFAASDRARSRALADRLGGAAVAADDLPAALGEGEALIEWHSLGDRLVIFRIDRQGLRLHEAPLDESLLASLVSRAQLGLSRGGLDGAARPVLAKLFDLLARPLTGPEDRKLILVPDGAIWNAPFAALYDRRTGRYLVEDAELAIAPSATLAFAGRAAGAGPFESVLALGNPAFDRGVADLPELAGAGREAAEIAGLYPRATLLLAGEATSGALLAELRKRPAVVHLATHSLPHPEDPEGSALVMAGGREAGQLAARGVAGEDLRGIAVVVLAACDTLEIFPAAQREGMAGWAEALLGAGVPNVAATLWSISDQQSTSVLLHLHRGLREGLRPAAACAAAQRRMIHSANKWEQNPARWAFLEMVTTDN